MNKKENLVYIDKHDLLGSNFYWHKGIEVGISKKDLAKVGLKNRRVMVHKDIIRALKNADKILQKEEYGLYITEGYRSKELYKLINERIKERIGEKETKRILNMIDMPHTTGKSVDVALWHNGRKLTLHNKKDGIDGYFVDFYKQGKNTNNRYQKLQKLLINIMQNNGFRLGTKREYFHFNYNPKSRPNY